MYNHTTQRAKCPSLYDTAELEVYVLADPSKAKGWALFVWKGCPSKPPEARSNYMEKNQSSLSRGGFLKIKKTIPWQQNKFIKANGPERDCICPAVPWQAQK